MILNINNNNSHINNGMNGMNGMSNDEISNYNTITHIHIVLQIYVYHIIMNIQHHMIVH